MPLLTGVPADEAEKAGGLVFPGHDLLCVPEWRIRIRRGHVMVIPHVHEASLAALPVAIAHELMDLAAEDGTCAELRSNTPHGNQFWDESGAGRGGGRPRGIWPSSCFAALELAHQFS